MTAKLSAGGYVQVLLRNFYDFTTQLWIEQFSSSELGSVPVLSLVNHIMVVQGYFGAVDQFLVLQEPLGGAGGMMGWMKLSDACMCR
jgi:hypothetical protein